MLKNNQHNISSQNEFNLQELISVLLKSKKSILITSLIFMVFAFFYDSRKPPEYISSAVIEIGHYDSLDKDGDGTLIQTASALIKELKIAFIHKPNIFSEKQVGKKDKFWGRQDDLLFESIEGKLLKVSLTSPSEKDGVDVLNHVISFVDISHKDIANKQNQFLVEKLKNKTSLKIDQTLYVLDTVGKEINNAETYLTDEISLNITQTLFQLEKVETAINFAVTSSKNKMSSDINQIIFDLDTITKEVNFEVSSIADNISADIHKLNFLLPNIDKKILLLNSILKDDESNLQLLRAKPSLLIERTAQNPSLEGVIYSYRTKLLEFEVEKSNVIAELELLKKSLDQISNISESEPFPTSNDKLDKLLEEKSFLVMKLDKLNAEKLNNESNSNKNIVFNGISVFNLLQEKNSLEAELAEINADKIDNTNKSFNGTTIFHLLQKQSLTEANLLQLRIKLEKDLKLLSASQPTETILVGKIQTIEVAKNITIIPFSFFLGLLLSISTVLLINSLRSVPKDTK